MTRWPLLNLTAGPVETSERTLRDLARPVLHFRDPAFVAIFERTHGLLRQVYRTDHDVVIMQGEAVLGLEAAAASLIAPGDRVLNLVSGVFGKWYEGYVHAYGGEVVEVAVPYDEAIDPEDVRAALRRNPDVKFLSVVHCETPSGTRNPVREIGAVAREHGVLTIVDTVSGLAGEDVIPEAWGIDVAVAGPQKFLAAPPGLSLMAISPAAWAAMERRERPLRGSYLSLLDWKESWLDRRTFPYTPSVSDIYALESALSQLLEEGVERSIARHAAIARACRAGIRAMGLRLWPAREAVAANCATAVRLPDGITDAQLIAHLRERYGVAISGGEGDLAGKLFRLGHMGRAAQPTSLAAGLALLGRALEDLGQPVDLGTGVAAAMAEMAGWDHAAASYPTARAAELAGVKAGAG